MYDDVTDALKSLWGCIRNKTETIEFLMSLVVCYHHRNDLMRIAKTKTEKNIEL